MIPFLNGRLFFIVVFWITLKCLTAAFLGQMQNVTLYKATHQTPKDPSHNGVASNAVDGNTIQYWHNGGTCTLTQQEINPFWQVDLGDIYVVDTVKIYNRLDFGSNFASNVETAVSLDGYNFTRACYHEGQIPDVYTCEPGTRVIGRLVKITVLLDTQIEMNICEVEVMSNETVARDRFRSRTFIQGTGSVLETKRIVSAKQCLFYCSSNSNCVGANVVNSTNMECELLGQVNGETATNNTVFWVL